MTSFITQTQPACLFPMPSHQVDFFSLIDNLCNVVCKFGRFSARYNRIGQQSFGLRFGHSVFRLNEFKWRTNDGIYGFDVGCTSTLNKMKMVWLMFSGTAICRVVAFGFVKHGERIRSVFGH